MLSEIYIMGSYYLEVTVDVAMHVHALDIRDALHS